MARRLQTTERAAFDFYTRQVADVHELNSVIRRETGKLLVMKKPLTLSPEIRMDLQRSIDQVRQDSDEMSLVAGQIVGSIADLNMVPATSFLAKFISRSGTLAFCRTQSLPVLTVKQAAAPGG